MIKPIFNYGEWQAHVARQGRFPLRNTLISRVAYSTTASQKYQFFQSGFGENNEERNSLAAANKLKADTLLIGIECALWCGDHQLDAFVGTDATAVSNELLAGFYQAGVLTLKAGNVTWIEQPRPFIHMPKLRQASVRAQGPKALVLAEAAPNTYPGATVSYAPAPHAKVRGKPFTLAPMLLLEEKENFQIEISFPTGAVNPIASSIANDSTNPYYLEVGLIVEEANQP